jgi:S1-C subfamily serine protease
MKRYLLFIAAVLATLACLIVIVRAQNAVEHEQMLYPTVLVGSKGGTGSGTVIFSEMWHPEGVIHTYVLTNNHVIARSVSVKEEWDSRAGENVERETRQDVIVEWYDYNHQSRSVGTSTKRAEIVAYDKAMDLALVRLYDEEAIMDYVAFVIPENEDIYIFDDVWAVGAKLGKPPSPTYGFISNLDADLRGQRYIMASAPIVYGNSGGSLYRHSVERDRYELIGVPSAASIIPGFFSAQIIIDMAFSIPMETVREFLEENCYSPIVGGSLESHCDGLGEHSDE